MNLNAPEILDMFKLCR